MKTKRQRVLRIVVPAAIALLAVSSSRGGINIAFSGTKATSDALAPAVAPVAQGTVVRTDVDTWNTVYSTVRPVFFSRPNLLSTDGTGSGAALSGTAGYVQDNGLAYTNQNKDWVMMEGWFGFRATESLTISNLPASYVSNSYNVEIYGDANDTNRTMNYKIGGVTKTIQDGSTFAGSFTGFSVVFTGLTNATLTITGNPLSSDKRSAINGLRIVPNTAPLPPAAAIQSFRAAPGRIQPGGSTTLRWTAANATVMSIAPGIGDVAALTTNGSGSISVSPATNTTYTLTAANGTTNAPAAAATMVAVGPPVPNIIVFLVDDMGWQDTSVPFYYSNGVEIATSRNGEYRTPNMEALAAHGVKFTSAYSQPVCSPTRVSLMTGKDAARHGVTYWVQTGGGDATDDTATLNPPDNWLRTGISSAEITLPQLLNSAGYRTMHCGKGHFGSEGSFGQYPEALGFQVNIAGREWGSPGSYYGTDNFGSKYLPGMDAYFGQDIFLTEALTLELNKALSSAVSDGTPFFAYMAHYAVHAPFSNDPRFTANYPFLTGNPRHIATMLEGMDKSLGDILAKLEQLGVAENTLVFFISDNGGDNPRTTGIAPNQFQPPLRSRKGSLYEGGIRVPMIVSWAQTNAANAFQSALPIPAAGVHHGIVHSRDVFPTVLAQAGVPIGHEIDSYDLTATLKQPAANQRPQTLLIHYPHRRDRENQNPGTVWREGPWKLIYDFVLESYQLYHIDTDIAEAHDLAAAEPARVMAMSRRLAQELHRLGAPLPDSKATGQDVPPVMPLLPGVDTDSDGLPDNTEDANRNGLVDPGETHPDRADSDGDAMPDGDEVYAGSDPLNPDSVFSARLLPPGTLQWVSRSGVLYSVEQTTGLVSGSWTEWSNNIPGMPSQTTILLPGAPDSAQRYFRVLAQ